MSGEDPQAATADAKRTALLGWAGALASSHAILDMEAAKRSIGSEIARTERRKSIQTLFAALTAGIVALAKVGKFDTEAWGEALVFVSAGLSAGATLGLLAMFGYVERLHFISEAVEEAIERLRTASSVKIP
ncbi:MAG: hypothetical protein H2037_02920 [Brevundimonas sp.]|nr:hypothetical protein [Brevundimonas sp.]